MKIAGNRSRQRQEARERCPQDPSHYLDSHAPGGAWYGVGHDGKPSPWPGTVK